MSSCQPKVGVGGPGRQERRAPEILQLLDTFFTSPSGLRRTLPSSPTQDTSPAQTTTFWAFLTPSQAPCISPLQNPKPHPPTAAASREASDSNLSGLGACREG